MSAEKGSSKADTLVKVVLVFFISLLSFSVGTFVGKQVSDSDHRRLALEGEYKADRSIASTDAHGEGGEAGDHGDKISEKEVESLTEEFVNKEKALREPAEAHDEAGHGEAEHKEAAVEPEGYKSYARGKGNAHAATEPGEHGPAAGGDHGTPAAHAPAPKAVAHGAPAPDATSKIADKVAHNQAPTDGMKEQRKPQAVLPSVANSAAGKFTVQVAAYAEEKEAKGHAATLKSKGWQAFYVAAPVNGKTWYRVSVGLFENLKSANDFRSQFMKEANTKSALVQKIVQ